MRRATYHDEQEYRQALRAFRIRFAAVAVAAVLLAVPMTLAVRQWTYHHCLTRTAEYDYLGRATWYCEHEPFGW